MFQVVRQPHDERDFMLPRTGRRESFRIFGQGKIPEVLSHMAVHPVIPHPC